MLALLLQLCVGLYHEMVKLGLLTVPLVSSMRSLVSWEVGGLALPPAASSGAWGIGTTASSSSTCWGRVPVGERHHGRGPVLDGLVGGHLLLVLLWLQSVCLNVFLVVEWGEVRVKN